MRGAKGKQDGWSPSHLEQLRGQRQVLKALGAVVDRVVLGDALDLGLRVDQLVGQPQAQVGSVWRLLARVNLRGASCASATTLCCLLLSSGSKGTPAAQRAAAAHLDLEDALCQFVRDGGRSAAATACCAALGLAKSRGDIVVISHGCLRYSSELLPMPTVSLSSGKI